MFTLQKLPIQFDFETKSILKKLADAHAALAELKGFVQVVPNQSILLNTLILQEAKDSSAVENIITTHDELFKAELKLVENTSTKEVQNYKLALREGVKKVEETGLIKNDCILMMQQFLEQNNAGYRTLPGTKLKNDSTGEIVYTPPQDGEEIKNLMINLIEYINNDNLHPVDPLIKLAIIHHQFESIHPFYDGNGRTGRILNILYLVAKGYLDSPILYLSRFIIQNKSEYYRHLQSVRDNETWEKYILFILNGMILTAKDTINLIGEIKKLMQEYKTFLRENFSFYSQDLLNHLFKHPYTKIDLLKDDLKITRQTASKYLNDLSESREKLFEKTQIGKFNYFINTKLFKLFDSRRDVILKNQNNYP